MMAQAPNHTWPLERARDKRVLAGKWAVWPVSSAGGVRWCLGFALRRDGGVLQLTDRRTIYVNAAWVVDAGAQIHRAWPRTSEGYRPLVWSHVRDLMTQAGVTGLEQLEGPA